MLSRPQDSAKTEQEKLPVEKKPEENKSTTAGQGIFDKNGIRTVEYYFVPVDAPSFDKFGY